MPEHVNSEKQRSKDPHQGLRYWIQLGQIEIAGFRECSGLTIETEMFEYAEGGLNTYTHKLPVRRKYANITLKRGMEEGQDLYQWYMKTAKGQISRQNISKLKRSRLPYTPRYAHCPGDARKSSCYIGATG